MVEGGGGLGQVVLDSVFLSVGLGYTFGVFDLVVLKFWALGVSRKKDFSCCCCFFGGGGLRLKEDGCKGFFLKRTI